MKQVTIYTDGACSGNPGPGGWGAILRYGEFEKELSGGEAHTTNNRMELTGVISALEATGITTAATSWRWPRAANSNKLSTVPLWRVDKTRRRAHLRPPPLQVVEKELRPRRIIGAIHESPVLFPTAQDLPG